MGLLDRIKRLFRREAEAPLLESRITQRVVRKARKQGRKPLKIRHKRKIVRESRRKNRG